jgi:hypothetical protein
LVNFLSIWGSLALVLLGVVMMFFGFAVQGINRGGRPPRF